MGIKNSPNAMRFITKNVVAVVQEPSTTIDWLNHYGTRPLANPMRVEAGDMLHVAFQYRAGGSIPSLQASIQAQVINQKVLAQVPAFA